ARTCSAERELLAQELDERLAYPLGVVLEGPVAALGKDDRAPHVEELALALSVLDADVRIGGAPHDERRNVQLRDRLSGLAGEVPGVGCRAVELEHRTARFAVVVVVHLVDELERHAPRAGALHHAPPCKARYPRLRELADDRRAPAFGHRVPHVAGADADV